MKSIRAGLLLFRTAFVLLMMAALQLSTALAQGTVFTYQGELNVNGVPANGTNFSMVFYVYNSVTGGSPLGNLGVASVTVSNGLFIVPLDFGNMFDGSPRWLEVAVEKTGPGGDSGFTTLVPRQQIFSVPYAIQSLNASNLLGSILPSQITGQISAAQLPGAVITNGAGGVNLSGSFSGSGGGLTNLSASALPANVALLNGNQTFSGSNTFTQALILSGSAPDLRVYGPGGVGAQATLDLSTYDPGTNAPSARIQTTDNNWGSDWDFWGKQSGANTNALMSLLHISTNGFVGIGTRTPQTKLQVTGDIQLGSGGTNYAISGQENLRMVRGQVRADGTIDVGSGFTVTHAGGGFYSISFSPAFSSTPAMIATLETGPAFIASLGLTTQQAQVNTWNQSGNPSDAYFSFIAIGKP